MEEEVRLVVARTVVMSCRLYPDQRWWLNQSQTDPGCHSWTHRPGGPLRHCPQLHCRKGNTKNMCVTLGSTQLDSFHSDSAYNIFKVIESIYCWCGESQSSRLAFNQLVKKKASGYSLNKEVVSKSLGSEGALTPALFGPL